MTMPSRFASLAAVFSLLLVPALLLAQPPGGGFRGGPGGPGGLFGNGGIANLLQTQEVQSELELNDDQLEKLRAMGDEVRNQIRDEMQGAFQGMRDMTDEERQAKFEEIRAKVDVMRKDGEAKVQKLLLPHQWDRLKQLDLQQRIQQGGANALTEGELADTLGLTDAQKEQLKQKSEEVQKSLQDKISQLRADARNQLLDVLTSEQRAKLQTMMGDQFKLPDNPPGPPQFNRRAGRNGGGGRGNRGEGNAAPATQNSGN